MPVAIAGMHRAGTSMVARVLRLCGLDLGEDEHFALPQQPLTRFAPAPTGYLHLGHLANAIWTWGIARATAGMSRALSARR